MSEFDTDSRFANIIIVGGGMVGLSLALMLAKHKISVKLLEAITYPSVSEEQQARAYHSSFDARNTVLSRRSVRIYQSLGLWDKLQHHATPIEKIHISEQGGFGKACLRGSDEGVENFGHVIENAWLGRVLLQQALNNPYIELFDGVELVGFEQNISTSSVDILKKKIIQQDVVKVIAKKDGQELTLYTALLIAADGKDSFCRKKLGIDVDIFDYEQVAIVTTVQTSKDHQHIGFERFSPLGPLALLPLPGNNRRSVVWTVKKGTEQEWLGEENEQHFLHALQKTYGSRAGNFEKSGARYCYPLSQVLAQKQVVGRVILMGNAAHTIHPVAGQGFNLCLRDADVLLRYLCEQIDKNLDIGDPDILKQYESARLKDQKKVIFFCDKLVRSFSNNQTLLKIARNAGLLAFEFIPGIKPAVANFAMGLDV